MKKILIISALDLWSIGKNKGSPSLWHTLKGYADVGWKVIFVTGNKGKNSIYKLHSNIEIINFDAKWLKRLTKIKKIGFIARSIWWLYFQIRAYYIGCKIARYYNIDIYYGYEIYGVPVAKILAKKFNKPVVSRFQGTILYPWINKRLWKIRLWEHILAMKTPSDLLIMTNDGTQGDKVLKVLKVKMEKVKFWINGVDKAFFDPFFDRNKFKESLFIEKNNKILLSVSRLESWKKVDRIIKAMPGVVEEYPDVKLLIIGDGSERKSLEKLAKEQRVESFVKFLGALPYDKLKYYYNLADIFISMYNISNVGNPLLEAMNCGKCIITLDVGDTNRFIRNGENGILLRLYQLKQLPSIIVELLKDDKKRDLLSKNALEFANKNFWTWDERIEKEIEGVTELCKK